MGFIRRISKLLLGLAVLAWCGLIFHLSRQSYAQQSIRPWLRRIAPKEVISERLPAVTVYYDGAVIVARQDPYRFIEFFVRKGAHLTVYAILAAVATVALRSLPGLRGRRLAAIAAVFVLTLIVALTDEALQSEAAMRTPTLLDVGIDLIGSAVGLGLGWRFGTKRRDTSMERKDD
ncbi:VanZ family protein [Cohnella nanjingensis]|uniref:VanZ family protein n=1 Tax=Cohnella nanjingensis TaxID=1387779 RepID=A0A7X0RYT3_9BACL|nr:VanZ family protein [Cohnella nanjingensis]MBB6674820.1 VanZ family protein [Cohnella nanjingensis]